ncbi:MAG: hypothetical protein EXR39_04400 [Betaproteobacteria bacterium]|nr:hypothetical protein [Betaproteobacteria bacterium]
MLSVARILRIGVVGMMALVVAACGSSVPASIADRKPGVASPALPPSAATKPATPVPVTPPVAVPQVPTEPQVEVKPIAAPPTIEARPIEVRPIEVRPPTAPVPVPETAPPAIPAQKPSAASLRAELKTEPRAFKAPYSDEALAAMQRGDGREASKPEARAPATEVKPPPVTIAKPEAVPVDPDAVDWMWPTGGRVIESFEANAKGLAIAGRLGDPVMAAGGGRVIFIGNGPPGYGQLVIIKHNDTFISAYAHNSRILVKEGAAVKRGQKIAEVGASDTDRPKLHFEIRRAGKPVDPAAHLPERR